MVQCLPRAYPTTRSAMPASPPELQPCARRSWEPMLRTLDASSARDGWECLGTSTSQTPSILLGTGGRDGDWTEDRADQSANAPHCALGDWDYRPALRRIRVPALVVEGAQTPVPLDQVRVSAESLVNGRLLLVEGAGHGYSYIEQPEVFFPAIEEFLDCRWPRGAMPVHGTPK